MTTMQLASQLRGVNDSAEGQTHAYGEQGLLFFNECLFTI